MSFGDLHGPFLSIVMSWLSHVRITTKPKDQYVRHDKRYTMSEEKKHQTCHWGGAFLVIREPKVKKGES